MTNGREPSKTPVPDSGSESDRRKWIHKRAQFDSAINTARLLSVVQNLAAGAVTAQDALQIILEVNSSTDQAQYVAEMLAMKKEFRDLARLEYYPEIASFLSEGSRLIPNLTDGLASQMLMAMGHAAQNDAYLETVSSAVSAMLSDLDHPLMTEARNYVRLLWDQMEATRRLKQTEAHYVSGDTSRLAQTERRSSGSMVAASKRQLPAAEPSVAQPEKPVLERPVAAPVETHNAHPSVPGIRKATLLGVGAARPPISSSPRQRVADRVDSSSKITPASAAKVVASPTGSTSAPAVLVAPDETAVETRAAEVSHTHTEQVTDKSADAFQLSTPDTRPLDRPFAGKTNESRREIANDEFKLPTREVPKWAVGAVVAAALGAVGLVVVLTNESDKKTEAPAVSASAKSAEPKHSATVPPIASAPTPKIAPVPRSPQPKPPASANAVTPSAAPPPRIPVPNTPPAPVAPVQKSKSTHSEPVVSVPVSTKTGQSKNSQIATPPKKGPEKSVEPVARNNSAQVVTSPEVSRTLSPLDRIIAELRIISPDPSGIEDKARELARIIARSKRKEARQIIDGLGPPVAVDSLGRDPTLEESLRTFAISVLGRVATDDDDNRAVDALLMLGEWVKGGSKGKQKALSALESLSRDPTVKTSPPRLRALKTAQAQGD